MPTTALALAFAFAVLAALTPVEQAKVGVQYTERGEPKKAIPLLTKAIASGKLDDSQRAEAEAALGLAYLQSKKPEQAVEHLELSLKTKGDQERTWLLLGMAHDIRGSYVDAVSVYRRAVKALPSSADLHHELGMSLLEAGEVNDGVSSLRRAVEISPKSAEYRADLAYGLLRGSRYEEAREAAQLAVSRAPDNAAAYYTLGDAEAALGRLPQARSAYERCLELDPLFSPAHLHLGLLEAQAERPVAAAKRFLRVVKIDPDNDRAKKLFLREVLRVKDDKDGKKATKLLAAMLKTSPTFGEAWVVYAETKERQGDAARALAAWEKAAKHLPAGAPAKEAAMKRIEELRAAGAKPPSKKRGRGRR